MKHYALFFIASLVFSFHQSKAQDTIFTKEGVTIPCEITNISENKVSYVNPGKNVLKYLDKKNIQRVKLDSNKYSFQENNPDSVWTQETLTKHFSQKGATGLEGIYEEFNAYSRSKVILGVKKIKKDYIVIYLSGGRLKPGQKTPLVATGAQGYFKSPWFADDPSKGAEFYVSFADGGMAVSSGYGQHYLKIFPTVDSNLGAGAGTGFAISSKGYIATNQHVTQGSTNIKVRGLNGDFSISWPAKVVIEDEVNDLAIIKIDKPGFDSIAVPPYLLKPGTAKVGNSVFVLGYPQTDVMGKEIKLTNGIISAKSGVNDDITKYQISVPVTHGNSGGPLFDQEGNVIGVVNSGLNREIAENANYAVKVSYLFNLLDGVDDPIELPSENKLTGKTLSEQVQIIEKFIYIIEVNQ